MRALVLKQSICSPAGPPQLALHDDYPTPVPPHGECLIRVRMAGICGTDLEMIRGYMGFTGVPGHEFVGEVVGTANAALDGRRVVGEINAACGVCEFCKLGLQRHCPNRTVLGILGRDGAFAEYLCLPDDNLIPITDRLADEAAVFTEPLAAAFEIFEQTRISPADRIAILGDGRLGAITALAMKSRGLNPVVGGHHEDKLQSLAALGIAGWHESSLEPRFDVVVDCTGSAAGLSRALALVRPRGKLVLKTTVAASAGINLAPIVINEIKVIGSRCGRFGPALHALESGAIDPTPLISGIFPLDEALSSLTRASEPGVFKVLLKAS
jgi:threonine dehydrogenase-like Zn-dependent dehydrogenase